METIRSLRALAQLVGDEEDLYVRWSAGPEADLTGRSRDELTGVELPGLSVSALSIEPWWGDRPKELWVARRLYDYRHLEYRRDYAKPWILVGRECGRGPDNEPLVVCMRPLAWVAEEVVEDAAAKVEGMSGAWGPLDRAES